MHWESFSDFECGADSTPKCEESLSKLCIKFSDGSRVCPADCSLHPEKCTSLATTEYKNALTTVNKVISGTVVKNTNILTDYVTLYNIKGTVDPDTNCWLNCMATSQCVGYKWDPSGMCTMYSDMVATSEPSTDTIRWMCTDDQGCSFGDLLGGKKEYAEGANWKYRFQPDPECPVFNCKYPTSDLVHEYVPSVMPYGPGSTEYSTEVLVNEQGMYKGFFDGFINGEYFTMPQSALDMITRLSEGASNYVVNGFINVSWGMKNYTDRNLGLLFDECVREFPTESSEGRLFLVMIRMNINGSENIILLPLLTPNPIITKLEQCYHCDSISSLASYCQYFTNFTAFVPKSFYDMHPNYFWPFYAVQYSMPSPPPGPSEPPINPISMNVTYKSDCMVPKGVMKEGDYRRLGLMSQEMIDIVYSGGMNQTYVYEKIMGVGYVPKLYSSYVLVTKDFMNDKFNKFKDAYTVALQEQAKYNSKFDINNCGLLVVTYQEYIYIGFIFFDTTSTEYIDGNVEIWQHSDTPVEIKWGTCVPIVQDQCLINGRNVCLSGIYWYIKTPNGLYWKNNVGIELVSKMDDDISYRFYMEKDGNYIVIRSAVNNNRVFLYTEQTYLYLKCDGDTNYEKGGIYENLGKFTVQDLSDKQFTIRTSNDINIGQNKNGVTSVVLPTPFSIEQQNPCELLFKCNHDYYIKFINSYYNLYWTFSNGYIKLNQTKTSNSLVNFFYFEKLDDFVIIKCKYNNYPIYISTYWVKCDANYISGSYKFLISKKDDKLTISSIDGKYVLLNDSNILSATLEYYNEYNLFTLEEVPIKDCIIDNSYKCYEKWVYLKCIDNYDYFLNYYPYTNELCLLKDNNIYSIFKIKYSNNSVILTTYNGLNLYSNKDYDLKCGTDPSNIIYKLNSGIIYIFSNNDKFMYVFVSNIVSNKYTIIDAPDPTTMQIPKNVPAINCITDSTYTCGNRWINIIFANNDNYNFCYDEYNNCITIEAVQDKNYFSQFQIYTISNNVVYIRNVYGYFLYYKDNKIVFDKKYGLQFIIESIDSETFYLKLDDMYVVPDVSSFTDVGTPNVILGTEKFPYKLKDITYVLDNKVNFFMDKGGYFLINAFYKNSTKFGELVYDSSNHEVILASQGFKFYMKGNKITPAGAPGNMYLFYKNGGNRLEADGDTNYQSTVYGIFYTKSTFPTYLNARKLWIDATSDNQGILNIKVDGTKMFDSSIGTLGGYSETGSTFYFNYLGTDLY